VRLPKCEMGLEGVYILHEDLGAFSAVSYFICICTFTSIPGPVPRRLPRLQIYTSSLGLLLLRKVRKNSRGDELNPTPVRLVRNLGLLEQDMSRHHSGAIQLLQRTYPLKYFTLHPSPMTNSDSRGYRTRLPGERQCSHQN
jgi:hypothetical protein